MSASIALGSINRKVVGVLTREYDLGRANVTFRNLLPAETRQALAAREVRAILLVVPLAEKVPGAAARPVPAKPEDSARAYSYRGGRRHRRETARV